MKKLKLLDKYVRMHGTFKNTQITKFPYMRMWMAIISLFCYFRPTLFFTLSVLFSSPTIFSLLPCLFLFLSPSLALHFLLFFIFFFLPPLPSSIICRTLKLTISSLKILMATTFIHFSALLNSICLLIVCMRLFIVKVFKMLQNLPRKWRKSVKMQIYAFSHSHILLCGNIHQNISRLHSHLFL